MANKTNLTKGVRFSGYHIPEDAGFTIGAETANAITVNIQIKDGNGDDIDAAAWIPFYLADSADGDILTGTAPDGGIAAGTDGTLIEWANNLSGVAISESDGDIDIVLTHAAGAKTVYLALLLPTGKRVVSSAITFA